MNKIEKRETEEQKRCLIDATIQSLRANMRSLIDRYIGEKTLIEPTLPRTYEDDQRFLERIRGLKERIERLQQQRSLLNKR